MALNLEAQDRWQDAEARFNALRAVLDGLLSAMVMRGLLNRAEIEQILVNSEEILRARNHHPAALQQLRAMREEMPAHMRAAQGPAPDPEHDHDH
jgi:hypothetical protein